MPIIIITETMAAKASATGVEYIIPSIPGLPKCINKIGITISKGSQKIICLVKEMNVPFAGLPMAVQNVDDKGCIPFINASADTIRQNFVPHSMYKWKSLALLSANNPMI